MPLAQIIYASEPFEFDELTLASILLSARYLNKRDGITGSLICRKDLFLQMLEGAPAAIEATFTRIARDARHVNATRLWFGAAPARLFADWDMRHDPMRSWMWSAEEVATGAVGRASVDDLLDVFRRVAAEPRAPV